MKKTLFVSIVLLVAMVAGSAFAGNITKVRMGTEGAYPPFNFIDKDGKLQGFDVDIAKALCVAAGVECEFVMQDWDGMIPGLLAKKFDTIIASMSITQERLQKVNFTKKYYLTPAKFIAKKGSNFEITPEGLKGKTVGVQRGTIHENFVRDKFGKTMNIKSYATQDEANMDLASGRVDLVIADTVVLSDGFLNKKEGKDFEFVGPGFTDKKWFGEGIGIAIRKEDKELLDLMNKAIDTIRANGEYQRINAKYFDFDVYGD
ncbi:ABC-type histidine transport system, periplasmic histidine-binding protein (HBP) precursor [Desulforapulum autotrophicum HRM2]|uniref:ABC-type histidine transport system, periplasmic histidine-binding protein (HBP) n=1 Tax=Desulforapulum autotrophicum (strain ATCC 43914 / DSM 3382 / VKM B-1955 / HRM2) TaxID=177437 RepID=C0QM31_DESAH|nr:ABC transporter substrate-binding protein [Desulforapulum autotrophicum]ACN14337.1 ABC-type histidine transport system, periplasmic histidine-binding protein (HBP) precursor [Desulforapulum autotrophicum HRM2]